jgi:hypothetical protein
MAARSGRASFTCCFPHVGAILPARNQGYFLYTTRDRERSAFATEFTERDRI